MTLLSLSLSPSSVLRITLGDSPWNANTGPTEPLHPVRLLKALMRNSSLGHSRKKKNENTT